MLGTNLQDEEFESLLRLTAFWEALRHKSATGEDQLDHAFPAPNHLGPKSKEGEVNESERCNNGDSLLLPT